MVRNPQRSLHALVSEILDAEIVGVGNPVIRSIEYDSRRVAQGSLFVAMRGLRADGSEFIEDAARRGAVAIVSESRHGYPIPQVVVPNARKALAELAWAFSDHPEKKLTLTAITGTNGKTTVATLLGFILNKAGMGAGVIGTMGVRYGEREIESPRTTPESVEIASHLAKMVRNGMSHAVMEATSIGIDLERTHGLPFRAAVFTNLTRDHLDYHGTWEAYRAAKLRLFQEQDAGAAAIINSDDPEAAAFISKANGHIITYGIESASDYRAEKIELRRSEVRFNLNRKGEINSIQAPLVGRFNVYNLLGVIATADALGVPISTTSTLLADIRPVHGRMEIVPSTAPFTIIVDYAHTPDALEKALTTLNSLEHNRILTVIGAGGNRDHGKRPFMAKVAYRLSDRLFLTSDNPRDEDPKAILDEMASGLPGKSDYSLNTNRRIVIEQVLSEAGENDIVLIAGKGHETYQEIAGVKHPFDDWQVAFDWLRRNGFAQ